MTVALEAFPAFYDNNGDPLSGGFVYTYAAGTLNPLPSYTDRGGAVPNSNPVVLSSSGRADIWLQTNVAYQIIVKDSAGNVIADVDQYYAGADPSQLIAAGIVPATGGTYTGPVSFTGGATFDGNAAQDLATLNSLNIASAQMANICVNSDAFIWQANASTVADGTHSFDRYVNLCETGSVTISQLSQPTNGVPFAMRQQQPDASAKRIGYCQQYEVAECIAYRGEQLVFSPKVRCSIAATIRVALVAWVGTLNAPPRDVINNWASTTYTAGNFFIANTLTIAVGGVAVSAATWTDVPVSSASAGGVVVPSNMNNLYLVVWTDTAVAQNVTLDSSLLRAGRGTEIPIWTPPNPALELVKCQRTFELGSYFDSAYATTGVSTGRQMVFKTSKRVAPTMGIVGLVETNANGTALTSPSTNGFLLTYNITATGAGSSSASWNAYAGF